MLIKAISPTKLEPNPMWSNQFPLCVCYGERKQVDTTNNRSATNKKEEGQGERKCLQAVNGCLLSALICLE